MGAAAATTETKPAETTPATTTETKPAETTPAATTPAKADAGTAGGTSLVTKPAETTPAETKPAEKQTTDGQQDDGQSTVQGAPEKYELTLPESGRIDADDLKVLEAKFRNANLPQDAAQAALEEIAAEREAESERFIAETTADPTYGGEKLTATLQAAVRTLDAFAPASTTEGKALRALLDKSGYGSKLEVVAFLARIGRTLADDTIPAARTGDTKPAASRAEKFYGKT
jgi:regulator of protease activity HflC (stomatin/prohibitin superfamily)